MDPIADYPYKDQKCYQGKSPDSRLFLLPILRRKLPRYYMNRDIFRIIKFEDTRPQGNIKIALKYNPETKQSAI